MEKKFELKRAKGCDRQVISVSLAVDTYRLLKDHCKANRFKISGAVEQMVEFCLPDLLEK